MFRQKFLISVLVAGCCAIPASAALVTYTDSGSFAAATSAEDPFQNIVVTAFTQTTDYSDLGVDFSDPAEITGLAAPSGWPSGEAITSTAGLHTITITLPRSVNAIEFNVGAGPTELFEISVTDNTGGNFSSGYISQTYGLSPPPLFFGVTTDSYFTSLTIASEAGSPAQLVINDISIGSAGAGETPEAATLLLVATGLFLMGWMRRRTPRRAADQAASRGTVRTMSTGITPA